MARCAVTCSLPVNNNKATPVIHYNGETLLHKTEHQYQTTQVLTLSLQCLQLNYIFVNNTCAQLIKMYFPGFSPYLQHPSRYISETSQALMVQYAFLC